MACHGNDIDNIAVDEARQKLFVYLYEGMNKLIR